MGKKLVLYGASNFGDEIVQLFRDINAAQPVPEWDIMGFLDDDASKTGILRNEIPVLGTKEWLMNNAVNEIYFVCCIGSPKAKAVVSKMIADRGGRFASGIHPSVIMSYTSSIGEGTVVTAGNILTTNIRVGNHVIINLACTVGHYTIIEDFSTINPGANISGDVHLKEGVLLGTNCTILEKMQVGAYSKIGAGAVVNKPVPDGVTAVGVPAKVIKTS